MINICFIDNCKLAHNALAMHILRMLLLEQYCEGRQTTLTFQNLSCNINCCIERDASFFKTIVVFGQTLKLVCWLV